MPRVGKYGMEMVAINDDGDIAYGNFRQLAEYIGTNPTRLQNAFKKGEKVRGYALHRHWRWKYTISKRATGKILFTAETKAEIAEWFDDSPYYIDSLMRYDEGEYKITKEKEYLWDSSQKMKH